MDIEHSAISTIQRTGYPDNEFLEWELRVEREEYTEDEEIWPDGVTFGEWKVTQKGVERSGKVERTAYSSI